jgi:four helix bundle protein
MALLVERDRVARPQAVINRAGPRRSSVKLGSFRSVGSWAAPCSWGATGRSRFRARDRFRARFCAAEWIRNFPSVPSITSGVIEFSHERLDVYHAAVEWLVIADELADSLPRGRAYLSDQLRRAAASISLNIAEGAGEFAGAEKARFYRIARRSATECAAILDGCRALNLFERERATVARDLLWRIVAMLTAMALRFTDSGAEAVAVAEAGKK